MIIKLECLSSNYCCYLTLLDGFGLCRGTSIDQLSFALESVTVRLIRVVWRDRLLPCVSCAISQTIASSVFVDYLSVSVVSIFRVQAILFWI